MTRPLRIEYPGALYHVTSRGNDRKPIFLDDEDRVTFLNLLNKTNKRYHFVCHAYSLMDNHYHLLIETPEGNLSKGMRQLNGVYTQIINKKHERVGHIFQGRYKAALIDKDNYLLETARYVVLNPVRAQLVESPEEWRYSSFLATCGLEKPHPALCPEAILAQFGGKKHLARRRYRKFVEEGIGEKSIWKKTKGKVLLGDNEFIERFVNYLKGWEEIKDIPKSQRYLSRPALSSLLEEEVTKDNKIRRDDKICEAVERYGYTQKEVADYLGLHYSTISRLIKKSEITSKYKT